MDRKSMVRGDRGFVIVLVAAGLLVLICALAGLAVDVGKVYVVKGELQNAADAAALAGAGVLYPQNSGAPLAQLPPAWASAVSTASDFAKRNQAAGASLTDADIVSVEAGYWNIDQNPPGIQPQTTVPTFACMGTSTPCVPNVSVCACGQKDLPAVRVTVQKAGVSTQFAKLVGWNSFSPSASAVAVRGNPEAGKLGFPFAVTKCMVDSYLATVASTGVYPTINMPGTFSSACNTGNWSSLTVGGGGDSVVQDLLQGSIPPVDVKIGDTVQIQPGTRANLYNLAGAYAGQTLFLPVVPDNNVVAGTSSQVVGFMAFKLTSVKSTGSPKAIVGQFLGYFTDLKASGIAGPRGNTVSPPTLTH